METDNKSESGSNFEIADAGEEQQLLEGHHQQRQFRQDAVGDDLIKFEGLTLEDNSDMLAEELGKMQEEMDSFCADENAQLQTEVETTMTENQLLTTEVQNGEHQTKQKDVEPLEKKQPAEEQTDKMAEAKTHVAIAALVHACGCRDANCQLIVCNKMKKVISHTKQCTMRQTAGANCALCRQFIALCCYHAKRCTLEANKCSVPFCMKIRQKMASQQINAPTNGYRPTCSLAVDDNRPLCLSGKTRRSIQKRPRK